MRYAIRSGAAAFFLLTFFCSLATAGADDAAVKPPRYALPVGRRITYSINSDEHGGSVAGSKGTLQITVLNQNADGSSHVLVRTAEKMKMTVNGSVQTVDRGASLSDANIFPDGRISPELTPDERADPSGVFPLLPGSPGELATGWTQPNNARLRSLRFSGARMEAGEWTFTSSDVGVMTKLYGLTENSRFRFDPAKGIIAGVDETDSQTYGIQSTGAGQTSLVSDEMIPTDQIKSLAAEWGAFFHAKGAYEAKLQLAYDASPDDATILLDQAKAALTVAAGAAKAEDVQTEFQGILSQHDGEVKYCTDQAATRAALLGNPVNYFATTDIDGKAVNWSDFKGKVVVMDFWYRGCGWCMYAMPEIKQVVEDFKDKPVVVLGMNTDTDVNNAKVVIDAQALNYTTLRSTGVMTKSFGVTAFPTLIVIDAGGIIRDIHVGYTPTLRADVGKSIRNLLRD